MDTNIASQDHNIDIKLWRCPWLDLKVQIGIQAKVLAAQRTICTQSSRPVMPQTKMQPSSAPNVPEATGAYPRASGARGRLTQFRR